MNHPILKGYFKEQEFACKCGKCGKGYAEMNKDLLKELVQLRELCNFPFVITSAFRCVPHNHSFHGKPNSAHLRGKAVDIKVTNSELRHKLLKTAYSLEFARIGINATFIHLDNDESLPQNVTFMY